MLIDRNQQEAESWSKDILAYEKNKRTKFPHGRGQPGLIVKHASHKDAIEKELRFNPVLGTWRQQQERDRSAERQARAMAHERDRYEVHVGRNNRKYTVDYDIVNFKPSVSLPPCSGAAPLHESRKKQHGDPNYQNFDIINGSQYSQDYLRKINYQPTKHYLRRHHHSQRNRDIINGSYSTIDPQATSTLNNQEDQDTIAFKQASLSQGEQREWNTVTQQFHNPQKQQQYQQKRRSQELAHIRQEPVAKLPPSYRNREELILDSSLPPSQIVREFDRRQQRIKDKYKVKYQIEHQHSLRNQYEDAKKERETRNRVHLGRVFGEKQRHDIINSQPYRADRAQQLYGKAVPTSPYKIDLNESLGLSSKIRASSIKQRAFSHSEQYI